jgi:hypothetical protein
MSRQPFWDAMNCGECGADACTHSRSAHTYLVESQEVADAIEAATGVHPVVNPLVPQGTAYVFPAGVDGLPESPAAGWVDRGYTDDGFMRSMEERRAGHWRNYVRLMNEQIEGTLIPPVGSVPPPNSELGRLIASGAHGEVLFDGPARLIVTPDDTTPLGVPMADHERANTHAQLRQRFEQMAARRGLTTEVMPGGLVHRDPHDFSNIDEALRCWNWANCGGEDQGLGWCSESCHTAFLESKWGPAHLRPTDRSEVAPDLPELEGDPHGLNGRAHWSSSRGGQGLTVPPAEPSTVVGIGFDRSEWEEIGATTDPADDFGWVQYGNAEAVAQALPHTRYAPVSAAITAIELAARRWFDPSNALDFLWACNFQREEWRVTIGWETRRADEQGAVYHMRNVHQQMLRAEMLATVAPEFIAGRLVSYLV